jgi:hypothetical protein
MAQVIGPGLHIRELGHRALQILSPRAERLVSRDPGCRRMEQPQTGNSDTQRASPANYCRLGRLFPILYSCCGIHIPAVESDVHSLFNSQEKLGSL